MQNSNTHAVGSKLSKCLSAALAGAIIACGGISAARAELPADLQARVDGYKKQLAAWAASPVVVAAAKESSANGGSAGLNNAKWMALSADDATVKMLQSGAPAKLVGKWESFSDELGKLNIRDASGNLVAFSGNAGKPALYNNADKAPFKNGAKGPWNDSEIKPDLTTKKNSVQIAAPIQDGGKLVGVIHASVEVR